LKPFETASNYLGASHIVQVESVSSGFKLFGELPDVSFQFVSNRFKLFGDLLFLYSLKPLQTVSKYLELGIAI